METGSADNELVVAALSGGNLRLICLEFPGKFL